MAASGDAVRRALDGWGYGPHPSRGQASPSPGRPSPGRLDTGIRQEPRQTVPSWGPAQAREVGDASPPESAGDQVSRRDDPARLLRPAKSVLSWPWTRWNSRRRRLRATTSSEPFDAAGQVRGFVGDDRTYRSACRRPLEVRSPRRPGPGGPHPGRPSRTTVSWSSRGRPGRSGIRTSSTNAWYGTTAPAPTFLQHPRSRTPSWPCRPSDGTTA